jgi:hypothetical protein
MDDLRTIGRYILEKVLQSKNGRTGALDKLGKSLTWKAPDKRASLSFIFPEIPQLSSPDLLSPDDP